MSVAIQIKDQIIGKVRALSSVQAVYPYNRVNPSGWPAVFIKSADMEGEFSSNTENSRVYAYTCTIAFPIGQDFVPEAERDRLDYSERVCNEVLDEIINAIDTDFELDGSPVLYTNAADARWGFIDYEGGEAEAVEVQLRVYTEKNIS